MAENEGDTMSVLSGWRIDKRIPVTLLIAIMIQSVAVLIWGVRLDSRVMALEAGTVTTEKFGRLDEKMDGVKNEISSLKQDFRDLKEELRRGSIRGGRQ